jgi:hypothetical protein
VKITLENNFLVFKPESELDCFRLGEMWRNLRGMENCAVDFSSCESSFLTDKVSHLMVPIATVEEVLREWDKHENS